MAAIIALLWVKFVGAAVRGRPCVEYLAIVNEGGPRRAAPHNRFELEDISQTDHDAAVATICSPLVEEVG